MNRTYHRGDMYYADLGRGKMCIRDSPWNTVRQGGGECHCHAGALYAGGHRGRRPAGGGGAGVQHLDHAVETETNPFSDGINLPQSNNASKKAASLTVVRDANRQPRHWAEMR